MYCSTYSISRSDAEGYSLAKDFSVIETQDECVRTIAPHATKSGIEQTTSDRCVVGKTIMLYSRYSTLGILVDRVTGE